MKRNDQRRNHQRGSALIFALILLLVLSAMAASLVFISQSETWSSANYRMMTQARYGAEAGVNAAANFLMSANYVPPAAPPPGQNYTAAGYNTFAYPVQLAGGGACAPGTSVAPCVVLSNIPGQPSTYPDGAMVAAFQQAMTANFPLQDGVTKVNYYASAQLMSMVSVQAFGTAQPVTIQTWQITAHGDMPYVRNAEAEVVTTLERYISPAFSYAAFADGSGCGQLSFTGNGKTNGYDSSGLPVVGGVVQAPTAANLLGYGGDVGTNGNETDTGANPTINGTLSTPNSGTGTCTAGSITAFTGSSLSQVTGGLKQLPEPVTYPPPSLTPPPAGSANITAGQQLGPCVVAACNYGDIQLSGNNVLILTPGSYNINSISISGNAQIQILSPDPVSGATGPVILNVANQPSATNNTNTPITITGNGISNPSYDPSVFQILCCATGTPSNATIQIAGNGANAAVVYAPTATIDFAGNAKFYGSVIGAQLTDVGNGDIYYDMKLKKKLVTIGNYVLNAFTWNKY